MSDNPRIDGDSEFDRVNANLLAGFGALCAELGGDVTSLMAGKDHAGVAGHVTYRQAIDLLSRAARNLDCPDFGMRLARSQAGTSLYGPLGTVMRNSRTLGEALDFVVGHSHVHSRAARITRRKIPGTDRVIFSHELLVDGPAFNEQAMELVLLAGHLGALAMTGDRAKAREVRLRHRPVSDFATYRRFFGCEVLFDQAEDAIVFGEADLACAIVNPDPRIHANVVSMIERKFPRHSPPLHAATRGAILRTLQGGSGSNAEVAAELGMHTRTLHRQLKAQGTTFQALKDEVRRELLRYYIEQSGESLTGIAGKLGFSEHSVMTRFCSRHLGASPAALRASARGQAGG